MALLRRALVAVFLTVVAGAALRLTNKQTSPRRVGGWRLLSGPTYR
jgi:hypothetical protein